MIELLELMVIEIPLFFLVAFSLVLSLLSLKFRANTGEESLSHLTLIFLSCGLLFFSIALGVIFSENIDIQYKLFALANFSFWFILMEIGIFYLTTFVNPNRVLPSFRLYIPAVLGAAVVISSLKVLESNYSLTSWELVIYIVTFFSTVFLQSILIKELHSSRKLLRVPEHIIFINSVNKIMLVATTCLIYVFITMVTWFYLKTNNGKTPIDLSILHFEIIDWLVFLNIPLLIIAWSFFLINIKKINDIISKVKIQDIYNTLGS